MKLFSFLVLSTIFLGTALAQESIDTRFEAYLNEAMEKFSIWLKLMDLDPTPPENFPPNEFMLDNGRVIISSMTFNRSYYGISDHIQTLSIKSNLTGGLFSVNFTYGSESDVHKGEYVLDGATMNETTPVPIQGRGNFVQMNRKQAEAEPRVEADFWSLFVTEDGYLGYNALSSVSTGADFQTIILDSLDAGDYAEDVKELMNMGIFRHTGGLGLHDALWIFMEQLLNSTPIEEIIGESFPPQLRQNAPVKKGDFVAVANRNGAKTTVSKFENGKQLLVTEK